MTRETKIGLLMGLGFIVVFAVLLSHTGSDRPAGDDLVVLNDRGEGDSGLSDSLGGVIYPVPEDGASPGNGRGTMLLADGTDGSRGVESLPRVEAFDPRDFRIAGGDAEAGVDDEVDSAPISVVRLGPGRRAPRELTVVAPMGAAPAGDAEERSTVPVVPTGSKPEPAVAEAPAAAPKTYVVQKGDNLGKITKKFYDTSAMKAVEFLATSNRGRIKDKDFVVVGQELVIPAALPAEMFEPAANQGPAARSSGLRVVVAEEVPPLRESDRVGSSDRRAPKSVEGTDSERASSGYRWYVIQPKDTLSSIAEKELGTVQYWRDIQKLNKKLEPTKMRPGDKIRLPERRPVSDATVSDRASA